MTPTDHEELTRVGPGSLVGSFMREYWIPALGSSELERDGSPIRLMLLGEKLIGFRDSDGRVGIMDHRCPHRGASLFLGRNEASGIRCIYHGWKFAADGSCVDTPSVPATASAAPRARARAYPTREQAGLVWVYMGSRSEPPPFPHIDAALLPEGEVQVSFMQRRCNWLQALEGDIDTSHVGFLHFGSLRDEDLPAGHPLENTPWRAPDYHVRETPWGTSYNSHRTARNDKTYWRCANFMFPFWTQTPQGEIRTNINARGWVPMDDEHTMFVYLQWRGRPTYSVPLRNGQPVPGNTPSAEYLPNDTSWFGRWRAKACEENDWLIDREAQRNNVIFSGIENVHLQDQAVTESMGPIVDHGAEHLSLGDRMVVATRRRILKAARNLRETRQVPPGVLEPQVFQGARSGYFLKDPSVGWLEAYEQEVATCLRPADIINPATRSTE